MTTLELLELVHNGESSTVELKEDVVRPEDLAKEICALLNFEGGTILLGVSDEQTIVGTTRDRLEEWVMAICRDRLEPPVIPNFGWVRDAEPGRDVAVLQFAQGPSKPYARLHNNRRTYYIRVGSTSQEASREELLRLFQAGGQVRFGGTPVVGGTMADLDLRRIRDYLTRVLAGEAPDEADIESWFRICLNLELAVDFQDGVVPTVDGILLFGRTPKRLLPQSGIRAIAYQGAEASYETRADETLAGPMVGLFDGTGGLVESGLPEQALDFVRRNTSATATLDSGGVRTDRREFPEDVVREVVVNALIHRDYSIAGTDITLNVFDNRLTVESPGRLPNTVSVESLVEGFRFARNQVLVNVMKDYRYAEFRGMGIRTRVIPGMRDFNGTIPTFRESTRAFAVTLDKSPSSAA